MKEYFINILLKYCKIINSKFKYLLKIFTLQQNFEVSNFVDSITAADVDFVEFSFAVVVVSVVGAN
jgi:hypothetical protein